MYDMYGLLDKDQEELQKGYRAATRGDSFTWIYFYDFSNTYAIQPTEQMSGSYASFSIDSKQNITGLQSKLMQAGDLPKNPVEDSVARIPPAPKKHSWH